MASNDCVLDEDKEHGTPKKRAYVWQPVKQPPKWCEVDPLDDWGIPEYTREDLYTPLFQRRAQRDSNPPDIFDFKFGNRYLAIGNVTSDTVHSKLLLGVLERHVGYVRSICAKLKSEDNKTYLLEVHLMLRALLPSVREYCYKYCYEEIHNYVCASLLKFNSESVFFMCVECYCHCADILRLLSCIQAIHSTLDAEALKVLRTKSPAIANIVARPLASTLRKSKKRKRRGQKTNLTVSKKSKLYRLYRDIQSPPLQDAANQPFEEAIYTESDITAETSFQMDSPNCSPIPKVVSSQNLPNDSALFFSFLEGKNTTASGNDSPNNKTHGVSHNSCDSGIEPLSTSTGTVSAKDEQSHFCSDSGITFATAVDEAFVQLKQILRSVLDKMEATGHLDDFTNFINCIHTGVMQSDCLPLLLCFELAKFKSLKSTTCMTYSPVTLQFWRLLYRLLGGAVIRALSGPKNVSQVVTQEASRGRYDPMKAKVNFAVPSESVLSNITGEVKKSIPPGIIPYSVKLAQQRAEEKAEFVISFDSKSIGPGVTGESTGDINMWGTEVPSLDRTLQQYKNELKVMSELAQQSIVQTAIPAFIARLVYVWKIFSWRLKALRIFISQEYQQRINLQKKIDTNPDAAKKYKYGLSKVNANIYQGEHAAKEALLLISDVGRALAVARQCPSSYAYSFVLLGHQTNCFRLLPPEHVGAILDLKTHTHFIKQGTKEWHAERDKSRLTGSTTHSALGLRGLPEQKIHFKYAVQGISKPLPDAATKKKMEHGSRFEVHANCTLAGRIIPSVLPPCYALFECGPYHIDSDEFPKLFEVSPDGYLKCTLGESCPFKLLKSHKGIIGVEFKCPYPHDEECMDHPHYELPEYYVAQVLLVMHVLKVRLLWYVCCTKRSTTVIEVTYNHPLFQKIFHMAVELYVGDNIPLPDRLHPNLKFLKADIKNFAKNYAHFLIEAPTILGSEGSMIAGESPYCILPSLQMEPVDLKTFSETCNILSADGSSLLTSIHTLLRRQATEIGVFMLSDTDRIFDPNVANSWPLGYIMKGPKMKPKELRVLLDRCRQELYEKKVPVLASVVDGQWANLCLFDKNGNPLTRLGLQKQTWSLVKNTAKRGCLKLLAEATCVKLADRDLLHLHQRFSSAEQVIGNITVQRAEEGSALNVWSNGGSINHCGIISDTSTLAGDSQYWISEESVVTDTDILPNTSKVTGLKANESNLLCALDPYVICDILDLDLNETGGNYSFQQLETALQNEKFPLLQDMYTELCLNDDRWLVFKESELFPDLLTNCSALNRYYVEDLKIMAAVLKKFTRRPWIHGKMRKIDICNSIASAFGSADLFNGPYNLKVHPIRKTRECPTLAKLAEKVIQQKNYPVMCLRIAIASGIHTSRVQKWEESSPVALHYRMPPCGEIMELFSRPEHSSERNKCEIVTMDVTHMLTNLRTNLLNNDGFTFATKEAWRKVADEHPEIISKAIVYGNADCQSTAFAKRVFSHAVENQMRENGDNSAADFLAQVRNWFLAVDMRGVSCHKRMEVLHNMQKMLTKDISFNTFPPAGGAYIHGIPHITYQAILQNIASRVQLFGLSAKGAYNQRVITSLPCESVFADMVHLDKDGLGTPKAVNCGRILSKVMHLHQFKHNPEKPFVYHTSNRKVYQVQIALTKEELQEVQANEKYFKDHFFDNIDQNNPQTRKRRDDITKANGPLKGVTGVRRFFKVNEILILPEIRLGIPLQQPYNLFENLTDNDRQWLNVEQEYA